VGGEALFGPPMRTQNVPATLYALFGVDPFADFRNPIGRPFALLDDRQPTAALRL